MKNTSILVGVALIAGMVMSGCATHRENTPVSPMPTRSDVFSETSSSAAEIGATTADIVFSVKSLSSRFFGIYYKHSDPPFRVYLNIDGQTAILDAEPVLEDKLSVDRDTPESGTGWRYQFNKRITLAPGKHKLTISIPVNDLIEEHDIELHAGANTLTLVPVYKKRSSQRPHPTQNFTAGVKTLQVTTKQGRQVKVIRLTGDQYLTFKMILKRGSNETVATTIHGTLYDGQPFRSVSLCGQASATNSARLADDQYSAGK